MLPAFVLLVLTYLLYQKSQQTASRLATSTSQSQLPIDAKHWYNRPARYPVTSYITLPSGTPKALPRIQKNFGSELITARQTREKRLKAVKESFEHSWAGYKGHAWLKDELSPVSGNFRNTFGGWAATLVDTLDTLWIMGMKAEFEEAVAALDQIDFSTLEDEDTLNVFETTIRYLGGLLAAYDVSEAQYPVLLEKAKELGAMLYVAFDTPNRMPMTRWTFKESLAGKPIEAHTSTLVAELGSLTLEFTRLAQLTGEQRYFDAVQRISNEFQKVQKKTKLPGMWPVIVNAKRKFGSFSLCSRGSGMHFLSLSMTSRLSSCCSCIFDTVAKYAQIERFEICPDPSIVSLYAAIAFSVSFRASELT